MISGREDLSPEQKNACPKHKNAHTGNTTKESSKQKHESKKLGVMIKLSQSNLN